MGQYEKGLSYSHSSEGSVTEGPECIFTALMPHLLQAHTSTRICSLRKQIKLVLVFFFIIPLFPVFRQKSDHAAYLTSDVLIPALLLGQIFQGTANLLSSAPADELSQHGRRRNPTRGEGSDQGLSFIEFLWPSAITQGLIHPLHGSQVPFEKLLCCPFEIKAPS